MRGIADMARNNIFKTCNKNWVENVLIQRIRVNELNFEKRSNNFTKEKSIFQELIPKNCLSLHEILR
ncbi:unnamed protein product, partial [Nesidiocoris tenuis]